MARRSRRWRGRSWSSIDSPSSAYLVHHDPRLVAVGTRAEALFATAPAATLALLRIFGDLTHEAWRNVS